MVQIHAKTLLPQNTVSYISLDSEGIVACLCGEWLSQGYMTAQRRTWRSAVATANRLGFDVDILQAYEQQA